MNKKRLWLGLAMLFALVGSSAWAAESDEVVTEVFDNRWFVTPHVGVIFSDQSDWDHGLAYGVSIGRPYNENFAYEFSLYDAKLKTNNAGNYKRDTLSAQALWFFMNTPFLDSSGSMHPYLLGGIQASRVKFIGENLGGYGPVAGAGIMQDIGRIRLRLEAKYQIDFVGSEGAFLQDDNFYTWIAALGVSLPLGEKPMPPSYDDDNDGVPNNRDKCPNTPPGVKVGPDGCPLDSDGDGVPDGLDQCPNTLPGVKVNSKGCAIPQTVELRGVHFEFNKSTLLLDSKAILDRVAVSLLSEPDVKVLLAGHTDSIGSDGYNLKLSQARAESVVDYLAEKGVPRERMSAKGFGESEPVVPNTKPDGSDDPDGREHNRRTELRILDSGQAKE